MSFEDTGNIAPESGALNLTVSWDLKPDTGSIGWLLTIEIDVINLFLNLLCPISVSPLLGLLLFSEERRAGVLDEEYEVFMKDQDVQESEMRWFRVAHHGRQHTLLNRPSPQRDCGAGL